MLLLIGNVVKIVRLLMVGNVVEISTEIVMSLMVSNVVEIVNRDCEVVDDKNIVLENQQRW